MIYYLGYHHNIITSYDLERAFYIITGYYADCSPKEFWKFRENCFGKSIKETVKPSIDLFLSVGERVKAIQYYKDISGCSYKEAKDYIDNECKKYPQYNWLF